MWSSQVLEALFWAGGLTGAKGETMGEGLPRNMGFRVHGYCLGLARNEPDPMGHWLGILGFGFGRVGSCDFLSLGLWFCVSSDLFDLRASFLTRTRNPLPKPRSPSKIPKPLKKPRPQTLSNWPSNIHCRGPVEDFLQPETPTAEEAPCSRCEHPGQINRSRMLLGYT